MSRPLRLTFAGALYHVTARGNRREAIFIDDRDRTRFNTYLAKVFARFGWRIYAWCQMSNHYHLLVETPYPNLPQGMRQLNGNYANAFNRSHQRLGHVFQGRYKAILVQRESYLLELSRYIVLNPVRAGMVGSAGEWRWSSFRQTAGLDQPVPWLHADVILGQFSHRHCSAIERYAEFVAAGIEATSPWRSLRNGMFLGDEQFVASNLANNRIDNDIPEVPGEQTRRPHRTLQEWERSADSRDMAIVGAYLTGAYTLCEIGDYFGLHYSRISRIVNRRTRKKARGKT